MTEQPSILQVMEHFFMSTPDSADCKLHVSEHVWRYLRETYAKVIPAEAVTVMMGLPIVVDDDLHGGQWQIRENGDVSTRGDMAPAEPGWVVSYSPITGWIGINMAALESPAELGWSRP